MSFRKKNTIISAARPEETAVKTKGEKYRPDGTRPSPLDGRLTTSTGTSSLDHLLAGHAGFPLGTSLLVAEHGTTDFAGALLRYYAAEGLVQGHQVHVLGFSDAWLYELPAVSEPKKAAGKDGSKRGSEEAADRMKIAWRYETLSNRPGQRSSPAPEDGSVDKAAVFCHPFDMSKRLASASFKGALHAFPCPSSLSLDPPPAVSSFQSFVAKLQAALRLGSSTQLHRVVIPSLLSPTLYPVGSSRPTEVLQFLHALRALLRLHSERLTVMISLPVTLFPRNAGLTRWIELLCDGVVELIPLAGNGSLSIEEPSRPQDGKQEVKSQGMLRVHSLPVYHEKGGGGSSAAAYFREDLSFSLSASKGLVIKPYSLPPLGEEEQEKSPASTIKDGLEF